MSIYQFSSSSVIKEVQFRRAEEREPVALITAAESATASDLSTVRRAIETKGWEAVPVFVEGKQQLQVSGFKEDEALLAVLQATQAVSNMQDVFYQSDPPKTDPEKSWLTRNSLKTAGVLNLVGDAGLLAAGIRGKDMSMTAAGGLYTAGALTLARYGNVKTERQLNEVSKDTAEFLKGQIGTLPEDSGLAEIDKKVKRNAFHALENSLYRHPADTMLAAYTAGAGAMLASGVRQKNKSRIGYGIWSVIVKATSWLMPEKKAEDKKAEIKPDDMSDKVTDWMHEKPLRVFGYGSMVTEVLLGASVLTDYKQYKHIPAKRQAAMFGFGTTAAYILSDYLMAISNKEPTNAGGKFDENEQRRIEAMAAEAILRAPDSMQGELVSQVAGFLSTKPEMQGSSTSISASIREQLAQMQHNPWVSQGVRVQPAGQPIGR